jgi:hypothetical protein
MAQALVFQPFSIALNPLGWHMGANPLGGDLGEHIQHVDHGLSDAQHTVERADLGSHMGRVSTLPPPSLQPSPFAAPLQEQMQQTLFGIARDQA